jgi:hypothetical protein
MTQLIPQNGRKFFYRIIEVENVTRFLIDLPSSIAAETFKLSTLAQVYSNLAIAALDLDLDTSVAQWLLGESAYAGVLAAQNDEDPPLPMDLLKPFLGLYVGGDKSLREEHAKRVVEVAASTKKSLDAHVQGLAVALACSILGNRTGIEKGLSDAKKAASTITRPKSRIGWASAMNQLAEMTLADRPSNLGPLLKEVAEATHAWLGRKSDISDQVFESYLAVFPLGFVARAEERGFSLPKTDPHPSMPMRILAAEPVKATKHGWSEWPEPPTEIREATAKALAVEEAGTAKGKH